MSTSKTIEARVAAIRLYTRSDKSIGITNGRWDMGLEVKGKTVIDFDGRYELPESAVAFLRANGFRFAEHVLP